MDDQMCDAALKLIDKAENVCPRCGDGLAKPTSHNALSRVDNATYICNRCGEGEALLNMRGTPLPPVTDWLEPWICYVTGDLCAWANFDDEIGKWMVVLVEEQEPGYFPTSIESESRSYIESRETWLNERHGVDEARVMLIVGSSMAASE